MAFPYCLYVCRLVYNFFLSANILLPCPVRRGHAHYSVVPLPAIYSALESSNVVQVALPETATAKDRELLKSLREAEDVGE